MKNNISCQPVCYEYQTPLSFTADPFVFCETTLLPFLNMVCDPEIPYISGKKKQSREQETNAAIKDLELEYRFLHLVKPDPFYCLTTVFQSTALEELHIIWNRWMTCAVSIEFSAFSEEEDRKYLLKFSEHFKLLMEALYYVLLKWLKRKKKKLYLSINLEPHYTYLKAKANAYQHIVDYTEAYPEKQSRKYIWYIMECIQAEGERFDIPGKNLLFDYESLLSITRIPYYLIKQYPALFKKSNSNP